jgi:excisionase family DNA binding protein
MDRLNSIMETARRWGVSPDTVRRLIRDQGLHAVRVSRRVLVPESEVARVCQEGCGKVSRKAKAN